ncbi:MAG TPA: branched-chain amino acid ABC transporter permease [Thermodesulfobacteriota bacterium]|nr:branched-chain amino acid ABC transporter permease [Thermodesulfobacteriota bacterium]
MSFDVIFNQFLSGIARGALLFLVASGLSLTFGVLRVLNFAHGSLYMLGAFLTYSIWKALFIPVVGFYIATLLCALVMAGIGLLIEYFILRRLYARGWPEQLLATYALILIITDIVKYFWGGEFLSIPRPKPFAGAVLLFDFPFPSYNFFIIMLGLMLVVFLWWLVYRTRLGDIIRAAAHDRDMVSALGIPIPWLFTAIFVLGALIAGLSGGVTAPYGAIALGMDIDIIIECFAVVVIGGMGSLPGTLLGSLIVGQVYSFGIMYKPELALAFIFMVMAIVLIIRPWGFFGRPER